MTDGTEARRIAEGLDTFHHTLVVGLRDGWCRRVPERLRAARPELYDGNSLSETGRRVAEYLRGRDG